MEPFDHLKFRIIETRDCYNAMTPGVVHKIPRVFASSRLNSSLERVKSARMMYVSVRLLFGAILLAILIAVAGLALAVVVYYRNGQNDRRGRRGSTGSTGSTPMSSQNDIQNQVKLNNYQSFLISNLYSQVAAGTPPPSIPAGRTILFQNQTASTTLDVYLTQGYPSATSPTIIAGGAALPPSGTVSWPIPTIQGWSGNFTAFPSGSPSIAGGTIAEFGLNQLWSGFTPNLRDTFDISTVPPGIGTNCNNGPRSMCVALSRQSGFSTQQSFGYNVGIEIIPPSTGSLPSQNVTCTSSNGDSPDSIGFPNDTAFPKQQTIQCLTAPAGNYTVNFLDPVLPLP